MSTYPNLNNDPEMLKVKTEDDENKNQKIKLKNTIMSIY